MEMIDLQRRRDRARRIHAAAAPLAGLLMVGFWLFTVVAELSGDWEMIQATKRGVLILVPLLILAMGALGGTGRALAGASRAPLVRAKQRRTKLLAANALLVLIPSAILLDRLAQADRPTAAFWAVQGVELTAGLVNQVLFALNARAGLRLSRPAATA